MESVKTKNDPADDWNNIDMFKCAKFGDRFVTRDGRLAVYKRQEPSKINGMMFHYCMVDGETDFVGYIGNGRRGLGDKQGIDIVSRSSDVSESY